GWRRTFLVLSVVVALILLMIVAAADWRFNRGFSKRETKGDEQLAQVSGTKPNLKFEQITAYGNIVAAAISPDGKQVVYVQENASSQSVWLVQLGTFVNVQLVPPRDSVYNNISFSHDGNYVYFVSHAENKVADLYRMPTLHGPATKLLENVQSSFSLSSDDREVVFKRRDQKNREDTFYIADLNSGQERPLVTHREP